MKSLKWEGFVTKNLFPHISNLGLRLSVTSSILSRDSHEASCRAAPKLHPSLQVAR